MAKRIDVSDLNIYYGDFLAVVAEQEFQAVKAMRAVAAVAKWQEQPALPDQYDLPAFLEKSVSEVGTVTSVGAESAPGAKTLSRMPRPARSDSNSQIASSKVALEPM